jgi:hypothetical protein
MYRQTAARLAAELAQQYPQLSVEVYQDGTRVNTWLTQVYDPRTTCTWTFDRRAAAREALRVQPGAATSSSGGGGTVDWTGQDRSREGDTRDDGGL